MKRTGTVAWSLKAWLPCLLLALCPAFVLRVNAEDKFRHQTEAIRQQAQKLSAPLWHYPAPSLVRAAAPRAGLSGLVIPDSMPSRIKSIEPPMVVAMHVLADGSLICVMPLDVRFDSARFLFAKYSRSTYTRVKLVLFDGANGTERWSRVIPASGVFDVLEAGSALILQAREFDTKGRCTGAKLVTLDSASGEIRWERVVDRPLRYFMLASGGQLAILSTVTDAESKTGTSAEGIDIPTGAQRWTFASDAKQERKGVVNIRPLAIEDRILFFENGIASRKLADGATVWERKDLEVEGGVRPTVGGDVLFVPSRTGLVALDLASGVTKWICPDAKPMVTKLHVAGERVFIARSEKGFLSKSHFLSAIDSASGKVLWNREMDPVSGDVTASATQVFVTTKSDLVALDVAGGSEMFKAKLPWDDDYSAHVISLRDSDVAIENEWNVAVWRQPGGGLVYHHRFEPLCPIMTTRERQLERKEMGASSSALSGGVPTNTSTFNAARYEYNFHQSLNAYRSTHDSRHLNSANMYKDMSAHAMAMERIMSDFYSTMRMLGAIQAAASSVLKAKLDTANSMIYPAIDAALENTRLFDDGDHVVRLVGAGSKDQRFAAIEFVSLSTGASRQVVLSPYQMPSGLKTLGTSRSKAHELNGYHKVAMYLHQNYSFAVDLQRKRIFYYGAGLNPDEYVDYDRSGFVRGRLWAHGFELPGGN